MSMPYKTADLCDQYGDHLQVAEPIFGDLGGRMHFHGQVVTLKAFEDNSLVRKILSEPGEGRVLVVDSGGSMRCAMLGDQLAAMAEDNGWSGVVVNGCVRDCAQLADADIGVKALGVHPMKTAKRDAGERDVPLRFAGVSFYPGHWLYADEDGIVMSETKLAAPTE